jgi:two-component system, cell cycle sensor histidine kinase and response regulator CckA
MSPLIQSPLLALPGSETILVVDDYPDLCLIASLFLQRCGYRVLTANNGEQAKKMAQENANIDLLLTDVEMHGMPGDDLAQWFRAARPRTVVVFMSGNTMQRRRLEPCYFVENPFIHLDTLLNTIREALHYRRAAHQTTSIAA